MGETVALNHIAEMTKSFADRARLNGRTFNQEVEWMLKQKRPLTAEERVAVVTYNHARYTEIQPSLTLDEIREGLM